VHQIFRFHLTFIMLVLITLSLDAKPQKQAFIWLDDEDYQPLIYRDSKGETEGIFYDVLIQGYIFSRPLPKEEFQALLDKHIIS